MKTIKELQEIALNRKKLDEEKLAEKKRLEAAYLDKMGLLVTEYVGLIHDGLCDRVMNYPYSKSYSFCIKYPAIKYDDREEFIAALNRRFKEMKLPIDCEECRSYDGYADCKICGTMQLFNED